MKLFAGIDLGGTKILAGIVNEKGKILATDKMKTGADEGYKSVIERIVSCLENAAQKAKIPMSEIKGLGIGAPGLIDVQKGMVLVAPNLPGWKNVPLKKFLEKKLPFPVFTDNDVNVGLIGEFAFGAGKGMKNGIGLFIGTGIGGGIIINGEIYTGASGIAGELGHIALDISSDITCKCGIRGCFEALASRSTLSKKIENAVHNDKELKKIKNQFQFPPKSRDIKKLYQTENHTILEIIDRECFYIGTAIANYVNVFNPEVVILGGGLMESLGGEMIKPIREYAKRSAFQAGFKDCKIVLSRLQDNAALIGGAVMAIQKTLT